MKVQVSQEGSDNTQTFSKCREYWEYDLILWCHLVDSKECNKWQKTVKYL
jgi:hypothetical protein